jgi:hypothetical protein
MHLVHQFGIELISDFTFRIFICVNKITIYFLISLQIIINNPKGIPDTPICWKIKSLVPKAIFKPKKYVNVAIITKFT